MLNLAGTLSAYDPDGAAAAARACDGRSRLIDRGLWAVNLVNLTGILLATGDWDEARSVLAREGPFDFEELTAIRAFAAVLHGDAEAAAAALAGVRGLRASDSPQDRAAVGMADAFLAEARGEVADALRLARSASEAALRVGSVSMDCLCWTWALATRSALYLDDRDGVRELLALLDAYPQAFLAPTLRRQRDLVRARLDDDVEAVAAAVVGLRAEGSPYDLAHGLLDLAALRRRDGDHEAADLARAEARTIGERLGCRPLLAKADALESPADLAASERGPAR